MEEQFTSAGSASGPPVIPTRSAASYTSPCLAGVMGHKEKELV